MSALADRRTALIRLIHVAKRDRRMDDEIYRDLLKRTTGKSSCAEMTEPELDRTLRAFKATGFAVKHSRAAPEAAKGQRRLRHGQAALITALWIDLFQLGAVRDRSDGALDAFVERQAGVARLAWLTPGRANKVIEALKDWCLREGFEVPADMSDGGLAAKRTLCAAIFAKLRTYGGLAEPQAPSAWYSLTADEAEQLADHMGYRLRQAMREAEA